MSRSHHGRRLVGVLCIVAATAVGFRACSTAKSATSSTGPLGLLFEDDFATARLSLVTWQAGADRLDRPLKR